MLAGCGASSPYFVPGSSVHRQLHGAWSPGGQCLFRMKLGMRRPATAFFLRCGICESIVGSDFIKMEVCCWIGRISGSRARAPKAAQVYV